MQNVKCKINSKIKLNTDYELVAVSSESINAFYFIPRWCFKHSLSLFFAFVCALLFLDEVGGGGGSARFAMAINENNMCCTFYFQIE